MKTLLTLLAAIAVAFICGCATEVQQTSENAAAAGGTVSYQEATALVNEYIHRKAKDPYSVQDLVVGQPHLVRFGNRSEWRIGFTCNAKNSFGAYTGIQEHWIVVYNHQIDWQRDQMIDNLKQIQASL